MTKDELKELRWLRGLVAEREGHGGDIPVWLALEWIDDAIKRTAAEPGADHVHRWVLPQPPMDATATNYFCGDCGFFPGPSVNRGAGQ